MSTITEIIPKDMPDWFKQDMEDGQVFARMVGRLEAKDKEIKKLRSGLLDIVETIEGWNWGWDGDCAIGQKVDGMVEKLLKGPTQ